MKRNSAIGCFTADRLGVESAWPTTGPNSEARHEVSALAREGIRVRVGLGLLVGGEEAVRVGQRDATARV